MACASLPSFLRISSVPPSMLRPLVVAAELHIAAVVLEEVIEVVGLHDHVVELQEAQAPFPSAACSTRARSILLTQKHAPTSRSSSI